MWACSYNTTGICIVLIVVVLLDFADKFRFGVMIPADLALWFDVGGVLFGFADELAVMISLGLAQESVLRWAIGLNRDFHWVWICCMRTVGPWAKRKFVLSKASLHHWGWGCILARKWAKQHGMSQRQNASSNKQSAWVCPRMAYCY